MRHLTLIVFVFLVIVVNAEDFYVSQTGDGETNSVAWFNDVSNWGSGTGKISPGDTVHVIGTITTGLIVQGSGIADNVITILFESNAKLSAITWPPGSPNDYEGGALNVEGKNYITIDGGSNGLIECTDNGTLLGHQVRSIGINASSASYLTVKDLTVGNLFVRVKGNGLTGGAAAIQNTCKSGYSYSHFVVRGCTIHDATIGIDADYTTNCHDLTFTNNTIYNCNWSGRIGDRDSTSTMANVVIANNHIYDWTNWDGTDVTSQNAYHHDGFYCWAESGGTFNDVTMYGNIIGPNFTGGTSPNCATAGIFISGAGVKGPIVIYNNLFVENTNGGPANGDIYVWAGQNAVVRIYNNTFIGSVGGIAIGYSGQRTGGTIDIKNNLCTKKNFINLSTISSTTITSDYNLGWDLVAGEQYSISSTSSSNFKTLSQWQALGYDAHSVSADPGMTSLGVIQNGSAAIGTGTSLESQFTTDIVGRTRGAQWDIGAYEYYPTTFPFRNPFVKGQ